MEGAAFSLFPLTQAQTEKAAEVASQCERERNGLLWMECCFQLMFHVPIKENEVHHQTNGI